ncbi:MAG: dGTPase, partial [Flavobacteriaceae bacterium]|nr:dGTPase [Flavobacteriaceae bacterium]
FLKYPKESLPKKPTKHIADKKYGFFQADKAMAKEVATNLGLIARNANKEDIQYHRHPLVYLVEAADDICYTIIDFEDGINLGLIPEERALEFLLKLVKDKINTKKYNLLEYTEDRVSYLRALAISTLIEEAVHIFIENETAILEGNFHAALLDKCKYKAQIEEIIKQSVEQIYQSEEVTEKEIAGYAILSDLLHAYTTAAYGVYTNTATNYHKLLVRTMPVWVIDSAQSVYDLLLHVSSYIASLSDSRAVQLHQKIQGKVI